MLTPAISLKEKLATNEPVIGLLATDHVWPLLVEICKNSGLDYLVVDREYGCFSDQLVSEICQVGRLAGFPVLCRTVSCDTDVERRIVDLGPCGILLPNVVSTEQLDRVRDAILMHPRGTRRPGGMGNYWGSSYDYETWKAEFEDHFIVIPQIESRQGVENVDVIASQPITFALGLWPYDLSADLECCGEPNFEHAQALERVKGAADAVSKMVSLLDQNVGRIPDTLDRLNITYNTVLVFTTGHGEHLGDHWLVYKASLFDELTHLPIIWNCPARFAPAARTEEIVSHVDLMPTVLDLAGMKLPSGVQGSSYRIALEGGAFTGRTCAYLEDDTLGPEGNTFQRTVRTHDFRLSFYLPENEGALYDLRNDSNEFFNRWDDPGCRDTRNELTELMLKEAMEAADPAPQRVAAC